jgi:hypothetical protein
MSAHRVEEPTKSTKTNGKRRAAAGGTVSRAAAGVAWRRLRGIFETPNGERWMTLVTAIINLRRDEAIGRDDEMGAVTDTGRGGGQLLCVLGEILALRRFSTAQLFELGSSEEAMHLCTEALARGLREPAGDGQVIRFVRRHRWTGDPPPEEPLPEEDETFAKAEALKAAGTEEAGA